MSFEQELQKHTEEDKKNFLKIEESLSTLIEGQKKTHEFMASLTWLSDISKATELLKKPSLWFVAFVLGIVALMGGLKALFAGIISLFWTKQ